MNDTDVAKILMFIMSYFYCHSHDNFLVKYGHLHFTSRLIIFSCW